MSDAINRIQSYTFEGCEGLSGTLIIPSSVTSIGPAAFGQCTGFTGTLVIPESVTELNTPVPPINGIRGTFQDCTGFTSLVLPESLRIIGGGSGGGCFAWCSNLSGSLDLPDSLTEIGDLAFAGCVGLTGTLTLPSSLTYIGSEAFTGCTGFYGELVVPHSVTLIEAAAFAYCQGFTSVTLGAGLERMEHDVFMNTPIETIKIHAETPPGLHFNAFNGVDESIPVYIPCNTLDLYRFAEVWWLFTNFTAAAAVLAALPLAGCHNDNGKQPETPAIEQTAPEPDTLPTDTIDYERMRRLQILLRGSGNWHSEK